MPVPCLPVKADIATRAHDVNHISSDIFALTLTWNFLCDSLGWLRSMADQPTDWYDSQVTKYSCSFDLNLYFIFDFNLGSRWLSHGSQIIFYTTHITLRTVKAAASDEASNSSSFLHSYEQNVVFIFNFIFIFLFIFHIPSIYTLSNSTSWP